MVPSPTRSSPHAGQRAIAWVRQSTKEQSETSCLDQANAIAEYAQKQGIHVVDRVTLDGVSGSSPRIAEAIDELVLRKQWRNDFDLLIVHDLSRLTRGGAVVGNHLLYRLNQAGVDLLSVYDEHLEGELGDVMASFKHMAAQQHAKAIAMATTRGRLASIHRGDTPAIARPPFGVDRLVLGHDGAARFILHLRSDGVQEKLDPETRQLLGTFGQPGGRGARQHYRKQDDERVVLIQGDPAEVAIIREIFDLYDVQGWGYHRICRHLNERGVPAPTGGPWAKSSLRNILVNPLFVGLAVTQTKVSGRYYARGHHGPAKIERRLAETAGRRHLPYKPRPLAEWRVERMAQFQGFLAQPARRRARRRIFDQLRKKAAGEPARGHARPRGRVDSPFILTNRLTARHSGDALSGRHTGRTGHSYTYYGVTKARNRPGASSSRLDQKLIPAPPLHALIVALLGETIRTLPQRRERVRREAQARLAAATPHGADERASLEAERKQIADQRNFLAAHLERFDLKVAQKKMQELEERDEELIDE